MFAGSMSRKVHPTASAIRVFSIESRMPGHEAMKRLAILAVLLLNLALVFL
jgi:hypothetical protein